MALLPGFLNLKDVLGDRIIQVDIEAVNDAFDQAMSAYNETTNEMLSLFAEPVSTHQIRYKSPVAAYLEALDEHGRARPMKSVGHYDVAFPLFKAGSAFGMTRDVRVKMTVQEANNQLAMMLDADRRFIRRQILSALFSNTNFTFPDEMYGNLTCLPLANNDGQQYFVWAGSEAPASANAFMFQAAAIADGASTNPLPAIWSQLVQSPENSGGDDVVLLCASSLIAPIKALADFTLFPIDPNIVQPTTIRQLQGELDIPVPGRIHGKAHGMWIVEWTALPAGYAIAVTDGGPRPLGVREPVELELRGFQAVADRNDHPYFERQFERRIGFSAYNRVGAVILQAGIGGTQYAIPSGYDRSVQL
jgi:hypothetical protein